MTITRYSHAEAAEREQITRDYAVPVQQARLPLTILEVVGEASATADEFRRRLVVQLQRKLPAEYPRSLRAEPSAQIPASELHKLESQVLGAVALAAHQRPELTAVTSQDRAGRECTEFFGAKASWMNRHKAPVLRMTGLGAVKY
ncbi:hypothetical protein EVC45_10185 [Paraburkholderia sp. UYCP14C]|uniref:hypothetical protein n=1 Tax=Paraburkholderia sp. UYCP14C TaxID=2511130 RepID=UPI001020C115|nr:hypothetical protein [Paraburkholderia sp. UYCP14C]RZF29957.1 hypothetical protein EVC45_10185 [Paraburkholderia sp. UYCP14C]